MELLGSVLIGVKSLLLHLCVFFKFIVQVSVYRSFIMLTLNQYPHTKVLGYENRSYDGKRPGPFEKTVVVKILNNFKRKV